MIDPADVLFVIPTILPRHYTAPSFAAHRAAEHPHVFLVDNSPGQWYQDLHGYGYEVECHPENLGVARSWNLGFARGHPLTVFLSQSVVLGEGGLPDLAERLCDAATGTGVFGHFGMHCHGWTPATVAQVGRFDENFYPAWYEDNDWLRRLELAGLYQPDQLVVPVVHLDDATTTYSLTFRWFQELLARKQGGYYNHLLQRDYYTAKWGGIPGDETYVRPFDHPAAGLDWWPPAPTIEDQVRAHLAHDPRGDPPGETEQML